MISSETKEILEDFEKRMSFINIVKYWLLRSKPTDIQEIFNSNDDKADNLILMVLLFIMDSTLRYGERCTKQDVADFLRELSDIYGFTPDSTERLTDYIITDVLQGGGKIRLFDTYQSKKEYIEERSTRILSENQDGSYLLTDEAYEFLFRTKEIDSELDFQVSLFKIHEFIKRGNYPKVLRESRELVSRVRKLKTRMDDFVLRCKTNIASVSVEEYDEIIKQVKDSFEDESKQLRDIRTLVSAKLQAITELSSDGREDIKKTEHEISEILANIDTVIKEQSRVYNGKFTLYDIYAQLLEESLSTYRTENFDFEHELIEPLQKMRLADTSDIGKLFQPLYKPCFPHLFTPYFFYEKQNEIRNTVADKGIDIGQKDNIETEKDRRNKLYTEIILSLFSYANEHVSFLFSEYLEELPKDKLIEQMEGNLLPDVMIKLYAQGEIDVEQWKNSRQVSILPLGEFDLSYCLGNIPRERLRMKGILIRKLDKIFTFTVGEKNRLTMNDFEVDAEI